MPVLLRYRVLFITTFFASLGAVLTLVLKAEELKWYFISLAPLLALVVSSLILFLLKPGKNKKIKNGLTFIALFVFAALLVSIFIYINLFNRTTFKFIHGDGSVTHHVKGNQSSYSQASLDFKKQNPGISDDELISLGFANPVNKKWAWSEESIKRNILWLITGYCAVVILFAALLSFIGESFVQKRASRDRLSVEEWDDGEIRVFLSYSHTDKEVADALKEKLEKENIRVIIDSASMLAGEDIRAFIDRAILSSQVTLAVISRDSLLSGWVSLETIGTFFIERFSDNKRFIAGYLNEDFFDLNFTSEAIKSLDTQLVKIKALIEEHDQLRIDTRDLNDDKSRIIFLRNNLDEIIHRMKSSLCVNISKEKLQENFPLLLRSIKNSDPVNVPA